MSRYQDVIDDNEMHTMVNKQDDDSNQPLALTLE